MRAFKALRVVVALMLLFTTSLSAAQSARLESPAQSFLQEKSRTVVCPGPVQVVLGDDITGSAVNMGMERLTEPHVRAALEVLRACGGVLGLGRITATSHDPFHRVHIAAMPTATPREPVALDNPFQRAKAAQRAAEARKQYVADSLRWVATTDSAMEDFVMRVGPILARTAAEPRSAICRFIAKAALFLDEPLDHTGSVASRFLILATDELENVDPQPCQTLETDALVLLAGGPKGALELRKAQVRRVESLNGALHILAVTARQGGSHD